MYDYGSLPHHCFVMKSAKPCADFVRPRLVTMVTYYHWLAAEHETDEESEMSPLHQSM